MTELIKPSVTTSALCITLPDYMQAYIDSFRKTHDKAYDRWPPHVNLVFPFLDTSEFNTIKTKLETVFKERNIESFVIRLDTIDYFKQADGITVHAKAKYCPQLLQIHDIIMEVLGIEKTRDFAAHLTLGQFDKSSESMAKVTEIKASWGSGLSVPVFSLQLVARDKNPNSRFVVIEEIKLM
jgi:2'-5' RNA ligase